MTTMKGRAVAFAITCLIGCVASGQSAAEQTVDQVYFPKAETARDLQEIATMIRTMAQIPQVSADAERGSLTLRGTAGQIALAKWLMDELEVDTRRPPLAQQSQDQSPHEFRAPDSGDDLVRVFRPKHATTGRDLAEIATAFRVTADIRIAFVCSAARAVAVRGTAEQIQMVEWLVDGLDKPADWQPPAAPNQVSTRYEHRAPGPPDEVARVFYPTNTATPRAMQELATTLRVIARIKRVYSFDSPKALVLRGPAEEMALAEWLVTELDAPPRQPTGAQQGQILAAHDYSAPDPLHGQNAVCVFHLKNPIADRDRQEISSLLLAKARIPSRYVCVAPNAVVARGTAAEIAQAEQIIEEWDQPHAPASAE